jgi:hypothetical protein
MAFGGPFETARLAKARHGMPGTHKSPRAIAPFPSPVKTKLATHGDFRNDGGVDG